MKAKAAVLREFGKPLEMQEFEVQPLGAGEVLAKVVAAGVCGSDVHIWKGEDPRTPVPIILGHEGIGEIADLGSQKRDVLGRELKPGDLVMWERGIMCGECYQCVIAKQPALCSARKTYGISVSCAEPPYLNGHYAQYIHLRARCHFLKIDPEIDPKVLVPASCSGATATHAVEQADVKPGDNVLVIGPGPVGLYVLASCLNRGAGAVYVAGAAPDKQRLELCKQFGAAGTLNVSESTPEERAEQIAKWTHRLGFNVGIDCTGITASVGEFLQYVAPYGAYLIPGIATPVGQLPVSLYEHLARKNVRLQGVWVSDTSHLYQAIRLVLSGRFPFETIVTHSYPLEAANQALDDMATRKAMKAVLEPWE
ncbi:MAG: alcohol dehydrogenase [Armatimonadetes bacterium CG_4_9_14_3_um_filter_66_14]|nr:MAG: alcohol dehydrogenase [Armatimonadetes bacterium CG_4_9_14_3_um_filter_66_14]